MRVLSLGILALSLISCSAPVEKTEAESASLSPQMIEDLYMKRYEDFKEARKSGTGVANYDILQKVEGALSASPLPRTAISEIGDMVVKKAITYTKDNNSSALLVYRDGAIRVEEYYGDTTAQSLLNSKSLAKPLGVIAVGRAIKKGHLKSLDQPVQDFITEWRGTDKAGIKVRHLLDMRSGFLPQGPAGGPEDILNRAYLHPNHDEVIINEYPLTHEPGSRYEYSNATSEMVAPLIERATGIEYEVWIAQEVLAPLGADGGTVWMNREGGTAHSGCCIQLPAETWLKLAVLVKDEGQWNGHSLLPDGFVTEMKTGTPQNAFAGMGLYIGRDYKEWRGAGHPDSTFGRSWHSEPYVDKDLVLFDGNSNQVAFIIPSKDLVILRLGNSPPKSPKWDNAYLPNLISQSIGASDR